jgi:iron complex outermembrane receptor protein
MYLLKQVVALAVASYCLVSLPAAAQQKDCQQQLHILVLERKTSLPVTGALVGGGDRQTMTDADGFARLDGLCPGNIHLHIQAIGFAPVDQDQQLKTANDTLVVHLKEADVSLDAVEIKGHRQALNTTTVVTTLHQEDLDKLKGGNLAEMLKTIPGVNMLQTGATIAKPVVNGMHSNRVLILNNGIRQEGQQWGSEHAPEIDPFIAQNISVIKGAEAIRYGAEAMGGVVIVSPPPLPSDSTIHAELNLVGASNGRAGAASGMLSGNFKKIPALSWRLQGTAKQSGNFRAADYYLENTGAKELNYSAALGYNKEHFGLEAFYSHFNTKLGIFKGAHIGNTEDLMARIANGRPFEDGAFSYDIGAPRQEVIHDLLKLNGHVHLNDYLHLNLQYGFQRDRRKEFDIRRGGRTSLPSLDLSLYTHTLDASLEYFDGRQWKLTVGFNGLYQDNKSVPGTLTTPLIPDYISRGAGVYVIGKLLKNNYELEAGVRYDYKNINALGYDKSGVLYGGDRSFNNITSSIGGTWHAAPALDLRTNIGSAWRPTTVNELYSRGVHQSVGAYEYGDSSLVSEKSLKWITALQYRNPSGWLTLDLDVYANYFSNYTYLKPTGEVYESLSGSFPIFRETQTDARFLGADLSAQFNFSKHLDYTLKGSVIRAKDISANTYLPMIPSDKLEQAIRLRYDPATFLHNSFLQLSHVFVAKQNRYEAGSDFTAPPSAYHLLNLGLGTQIISGKQSLNVSFSIDNLTNTLYKDYMNRFRYYAHDLGRNFVLRLTYRI